MLRFSRGGLCRPTDARPGRPRLLGNASDHFDFEVEAGELGHTDRRPVGIGLSAEDLALDGHDRLELIFGVRVKARHIDDIREGAAGRVQRCLQVVEGQLDLPSEVRFGSSIGAAADLPGDKKKVA